MIYLYSGTPGSGKSYHATYDAYVKLRRKNKNTVIANFAFDSSFKGCRGRFIAKDHISLQFLYDFAKNNHKFGVEGQTLIIFDEAQLVFNSRDWNGKGIQNNNKTVESRMSWIKFLSQHRKLGYNVIMVAHNDKMIDRQIRALIEYDIKHIKINNGFFAFLPFTSFLTVEKWYGQNIKLGNQCLVYRPKIANLYDSYKIFDGAIDDDFGWTAPPSSDERGEPPQGGGGSCSPDEGQQSPPKQYLMTPKLSDKFKRVFRKF